MHNLEGKPATDIDQETDRWFQDILNAKQAYIPKRSHRTIPFPSSSPELLLLQTMYAGIRSLSDLRGWNQEIRTEHSLIKERLIETCRVHYQTKWAELTTRLSATTRDPMEFWRKLKTLMGSTTTHSPYLSDSQGNKHFKDTEKEVIHYNYWNNIFQITEHENQLFDEETDERVMEELEAHTDTLNTDPIINLENLRIDDPLISPITTDETVNVIIRIKNKSPGTNQIIKTDLTNLPLMMIQRLTAIFNASLTCGYFPKKFKQALITLIPKAGKPNRPENFRPISLL